MTEQSQQPTSTQVGELWETTSPGWLRNADMIDRMSVEVRKWIVDRVDPQPGQTILELAAGAGDTGFDVAKSLGAGGKLISSDISRSMVYGARKRAEHLGLSNIEFQILDAQRIDAASDSVDGVIHRYGPMLLPDPDASFAEVRRVLRPGGRYASVVWAGPDLNPWILMTGMSLMQAGTRPPGDPHGSGGLFSLADPDALRQRIANAGFDDVEVEAVTNSFEFSDFEELWRIPSEIAGPIAVIIAELGSEQVAQVKDAFKRMAEQFQAADGYKIPASSLCALAR